ncbi:MAG: thioredoxin family protein [Candidatus Aegiribacteria sp.]|nr:thioredoxin family protein [Candidatus Aegiribacteria sp.]
MKKYMIILIIAGLITGACGDSDSTPPQNGNGQQQDASGELIWFVDDFDAASAEAESSGRPLLIDMYADWCGPCVTLGEQYFTSDEMYPILSNFVLLRLDVDNPDVAPYAQQYNVSAIPCVVIAKADGSEIDRIVGTTSTIAEYIRALEDVYRQI